jgi:hypothetical protein
MNTVHAETRPVTIHDANTERVKEFAHKMAEATSLARIAEAIIELGTSQAWRDYDIDGYPCKWEPAEYDYALITCGIKYTDFAELLKGRETAIALVPLMDPRSPDHRHPQDASQAWGSPKPGVTLLSLAKDLGWISERGRARKPPFGRRTRDRGAGMSWEAKSRAARRERLGDGRCAELEDQARELATELTVDETRELADLLRDVLRGR